MVWWQTHIARQEQSPLDAACSCSWCCCCWHRRPSPPRKVLHFPSGRRHCRVDGGGSGGGVLRTTICFKHAISLVFTALLPLVPAIFVSFWFCPLYNVTSTKSNMPVVTTLSARSHSLGVPPESLCNSQFLDNCNVLVVSACSLLLRR